MTISELAKQTIEILTGFEAESGGGFAPSTTDLLVLEGIAANPDWIEDLERCEVMEQIVIRNQAHARAGEPWEVLEQHRRRIFRHANGIDEGSST